MKVAYFAHDLADPAVSRRVAMLASVGTEFVLYGFRRTEKPITEVAGFLARDLGRTYDGRLLQRAYTVFLQWFRARAWAKEVASADVIIARNLEMLVIADAACRAARRSVPMIYELLDIHSMMLVTGPPPGFLGGLKGSY